MGMLAFDSMRTTIYNVSATATKHVTAEDTICRESSAQCAKAKLQARLIYHEVATLLLDVAAHAVLE